MARAQQDAVWNRQQLANQLRSLLREYYPSAIDAFAKWDNGLCRPEARVLLELAPTPARAARLSLTQLRSALKRAGRQRGRSQVHQPNEAPVDLTRPMTVHMLAAAAWGSKCIVPGRADVQ